MKQNLHTDLVHPKTGFRNSTIMHTTAKDKPPLREANITRIFPDMLGFGGIIFWLNGIKLVILNLIV